METLKDQVPEMLGLEEIVRIGVRKMLEIGLSAEVAEYVGRMGGVLTADKRSAIVCNGFHREREIFVGSGPVPVKVPRTRNRNGDKENFVSRLVPPYRRRSLAIDEAIPLLYLKGISGNDMAEVLGGLFGPGFAGASPANVMRLKSVWEKEYELWNSRDLSFARYCYIWVDGIYFNLRHGDSRLCVLVVIGATENGEKELVAVGGGYRESAESWSCIIRDIISRGLVPPRLAIGDGSLGFWSAKEVVMPETKGQRCWVHKTANVLDKLPKCVQKQAKPMIHEIYMSPTKALADKAFDRFINVFGPKYPKAAECLSKDRESLLNFYAFPAEHWKHIRTTNAIESTFATVRLRTDKTRGHGSMGTTLQMVFKLVDAASKGWQRLSGHKLIPKVLDNVKFVDGVEAKEKAA
jgi:transposase-like protein